MIAVDTNILVRLFVDANDSAQKMAVASFLKELDSVYVGQIVQIEFVWVLESVYQYSKSQIISALMSLKNLDIFLLENPTQFSHALELYQSANADFSDYMIFANSQDNDHEFWTFDKKLAKTAGIHHLKTS